MLQNFDTTKLQRTDFSASNLNEQPEKDFAVYFAYGANMNPTIFLDRIRADWQEIDSLTELSKYFLGPYMARNRALEFNKRGIDGMSRANIVPRMDSVCYGSAYLLPKKIMFSPSSKLNSAEGCVNPHVVSDNGNHYWLRQLKDIHPYKEQEVIRDFPSYEGSEVIQYAWFYEAAPNKIEANLPPSKTYVDNILRGMKIEDKLIVPQSYYDSIKAILNV